MKKHLSFQIMKQILDAKTFTELGRATTDVTGIPYGFHHTFIPQ